MTVPETNAAPTALHIDGVGSVHLVRSSRARNISISVRPFQPVRVCAPVNVPYARVQQIITAKAAWLRRSVAQVRALEARRVQAAAANPPMPEPAARQLLAHRLAELAAQHGFTYRRVSFRRQRTRWASCSTTGNISLNLALAELPAPLRDYVLLHELVHTEHPNHSDRFWARLAQLVGPTEPLRRRLKQYHCRPIQPQNR